MMEGLWGLRNRRTFALSKMKIYKNYLNKAAEHKADRFTYRIWANKLKHMKTIKGGKECVNDIICTWKTLYHNRRAMMQEISIVDNEN